MKLAIITSNHLRHNFFVDFLSQSFDVVGLIREEKKRDPSKKGEGTDLSTKVLKYFKDREDSERVFFGSVNWKNTLDRLGDVITINAGEINNKENIEILKSWNPDYIAVFGSSILGKEIIDLFPNRIINMHLGLSPYYRGSGTNFWPLYDEKPEYVGVTIHYLDAGIDTGKIIAQAKPDIELGDTPHSIGNKTIKKGVETLKEVLDQIVSGDNIIAKEQDLSLGKLCLFKDCLPEHIIELQKKFDDGLVEKYLRRINKI